LQEEKKCTFKLANKANLELECVDHHGSNFSTLPTAGLKPDADGPGGEGLTEPPKAE